MSNPTTATVKKNPTREILDEYFDELKNANAAASALSISKSQQGNVNDTSLTAIAARKRPVSHPQLTFDEFKVLVLKQLEIGPDLQKLYATAANQKSSQWLEVKERRLTSSQFGASAEHNTYQTAEQLLKSKLWPTRFNNAHMAFGTKYENVAKYVFEKFLRANAETLIWIRKQDPLKYTMPSKECLTKFKPDAGTLQAFKQYELQTRHLQNRPLSETTNSTTSAIGVPYDQYCTPTSSLQVVVSMIDPWLGFSPDGVVLEDGKLGGLEIKCPGTQVIPTYIPHSHYDQMQGTMYIAGWEFYYYVVYTPEFTLIRKLIYDKKYCETILYPRMKDWYMNHYVRALWHKHCGRLEDGECEPMLRL